MTANNGNKKTRNSAIELVRLLAMFMIVYYHLILFFVEPVDTNPIYKAIQIPLHIGVILFVLISGYFGIRPSFRGFLKILCIVAVYFLPLRLWYVYNMNMGGMAMLDSFHVLSKTPYWFVRTYLCLYLVSPLLNKCLKDISTRERIYYLFSFSVIAVYLGLLQCDISLIDGKNLANFILIYIIGNTIKIEHDKLSRLSNKTFLGIFFFMNIVLAFLFCHFHNTRFSDFIWNWSFPYYSPFLLISSFLFFFPFTRFDINSPKINYLAASAFSIYIIHHQPVVMDMILQPIAHSIYTRTAGNVTICLVMMGLFALFILFISVLIDKLLTPLWRVLDKMGIILEGMISRCFSSNHKSEFV